MTVRKPPVTKLKRQKVVKVQAPRKVSHTAIARIGEIRSRHAREQKTQTFALDARHPKGVGPNTGKASPVYGMDDLSGYSNWASTSLAQTAYAEGLAFLGYPMLAEMAQRPEYRRMSETLARHMTRKWIKFKSKSEKDQSERIARIEEMLTEFRAPEVFKRALEQDNYFGRGHIYLEFCDTNDRDELQKSVGNGKNAMSRAKVGTDKPIKGIRAVEAVWVYPNGYNTTDPLSAQWYQPQSWFVMNKEVHTSRLLTFTGREVPDLLKPAYSFGGLSLSQLCKPYVDNWLRTRQAVADIVSNFSVFVMKTDLLSQLEGGAEGLVNRLTVFNNLRDNAGVLALDMKDEDFGNVSAPISGLDHLQAQTQEHMAAVSGIPLIELLGISPSGLNASSEGEIKTFYDWIHACQESMIRPNLERLVSFVQLSLFGTIDDDLTFDFEPLDTLDPSEEATRRKTIADTHAAYEQMGVVSADEIREALASDEDSPYTNLDLSGPAPGVPGEEEGMMGGGPPMPDPNDLAQGDPNEPDPANDPDAGAANAPELAANGGNTADDIEPGAITPENAAPAPAPAPRVLQTSIGARQQGTNAPRRERKPWDK